MLRHSISNRCSLKQFNFTGGIFEKGYSFLKLVADIGWRYPRLLFCHPQLPSDTHLLNLLAYKGTWYKACFFFSFVIELAF